MREDALDPEKKPRGGASSSRQGTQRLRKKQQASAEEILDAAAKAFRRRGYAATSVDDVADILGCTKGRVYHYFRSKGDLFIGIHRRALTWALEAVEPVALDASLEPREKLEQMVRRHVFHLMDHTDYMGPSQYHTYELNLTHTGTGRSREGAINDIFEMRQRFETYFIVVLKAGMATGDFREGDASMIAKAMLGSVNWMSVWFHPDHPQNTPEGRDQIASEFTQYAMHGVLS